LEGVTGTHHSLGQTVLTATMVNTEGRLVAAFCALLTVVYGQVDQGPDPVPTGLITGCSQKADDNATIYDFTMLDLSKTKNIPLSNYRGKVVLVVNVATY